MFRSYAIFCRLAFLLSVSTLLTARASDPIVDDWSIDLSGPMSASPVVRDLDGDGDYEILISIQMSFDADFSPLGAEVQLLSHLGHSLKGWPVRIEADAVNGPPAELRVSPSVGDIDGDGNLDIVVGDTHGYLHAWELDGTPKLFTEGAVDNRLKLDGSIKSVVRLIDIDGDGSDELLVHSGASKLYLLNGDGTDRAGWPVDLGGSVEEFGNWTIGSTPVALDFDFDGEIEIAVATTGGKVHVYDVDGNAVSGWPKSTDGDGFHLSSLVAVDLNGDYQLELVLGGADGKVYAWDLDGSVMEGFPAEASGASIVASVAVADFRSDYEGPELVVADVDKNVHCFTNRGVLLSGWPQQVGGEIIGSPIIVDVDNDNQLEIVVPSKDNILHIFSANGAKVSGLSFVATDWIESTPACTDLDNDGDLELLYAGLDAQLYCVQLGTRGANATNSIALGWNGFLGDRGDSANGPTGDLDSDLIADDYERYYFGGTEFGADDDFDLDGSSNYVEWGAGTNPTDSSDQLSIDGITFGIDIDDEVEGEEVVKLTWKTKVGHRYDIYSKQQLDGSWSLVEQNVDFGVNAEITWLMQIDPAAAQCFYSIGAIRAFASE